MNSAFPLSALPAGAADGCWAITVASKIAARIDEITSLPRLGHHVNQSRLTAFYGRDRAAQGGSKIFGIGYRSFGMNAQSLRKLCEIYIGIRQRRSLRSVFD